MVFRILVSMKLPELSKLKILDKRSDGKTTIFGITGKEWALDIAALLVLYVILAIFFIVLLEIAQAVRLGSDTVS